MIIPLVFRSLGEKNSKHRSKPYGIVDEVYGVRFKTADMITQNLGQNIESFAICRAGIFYTLEYLTNPEGHCYVPLDELISKCSKMLSIEDSKIVMTYDDLVRNKELIIENKDKVYLPEFSVQKSD